MVHLHFSLNALQTNKNSPTNWKTYVKFWTWGWRVVESLWWKGPCWDHDSIVRQKLFSLPRWQKAHDGERRWACDLWGYSGGLAKCSGGNMLAIYFWWMLFSSSPSYSLYIMFIGILGYFWNRFFFNFKISLWGLL